MSFSHLFHEKASIVIAPPGPHILASEGGHYKFCAAAYPQAI
jgi:hypothetical protein